MTPLSVLAVGLTAAVVIDIRIRRIPNWLTALLAGAGLGMAATGLSGVTPGQAFLGLGLGLLLMLPGYALGATGAGDVKLMAAVGAVVGPAVVFTAFLCTAVTGGVFAVFVAARRGRLKATLQGTRQLVVAPSEASEVIKEPARANRFAYGPAIAIGSMLAVLMR
jgi:prepilin peptidase CpaA